MIFTMAKPAEFYHPTPVSVLPPPIIPMGENWDLDMPSPLRCWLISMRQDQPFSATRFAPHKTTHKTTQSPPLPYHIDPGDTSAIRHLPSLPPCPRHPSLTSLPLRPLSRVGLFHLSPPLWLVSAPRVSTLLPLMILLSWGLSRGLLFTLPLVLIQLVPTFVLLPKRNFQPNIKLPRMPKQRQLRTTSLLLWLARQRAWQRNKSTWSLSLRQRPPRQRPKLRNSAISWLTSARFVRLFPRLVGVWNLPRLASSIPTRKERGWLVFLLPFWHRPLCSFNLPSGRQSPPIRVLAFNHHLVFPLTSPLNHPLPAVTRPAQVKATASPMLGKMKAKMKILSVLPWVNAARLLVWKISRQSHAGGSGIDLLWAEAMAPCRLLTILSPDKTFVWIGWFLLFLDCWEWQLDQQWLNGWQWDKICEVQSRWWGHRAGPGSCCSAGLVRGGNNHPDQSVQQGQGSNPQWVLARCTWNYSPNPVYVGTIFRGLVSIPVFC